MNPTISQMDVTVTPLPSNWSDALGAVTSGMTSVLGIVTADTLLLALVFGFLFMRKGVGLTKKIVKLGGRS